MTSEERARQEDAQSQDVDGQKTADQAGATATEELRQALDTEKSKAESYYANWQRSQADFVNYKRRAEQERGDAVQIGQAMVFAGLIPIMDDLERALQSVPPQVRAMTWTDGVVLIYRKLQALLEAYNVEVIKAVGQPFDPNVHEAIMQAPGPEGRVVAEIQKGYKLAGRVIRPSLVQVGDGSVSDNPAKTANETETIG